MVAADLAPLLEAAATGALPEGLHAVPLRPEPHVGVVLAAAEYPRAGATGLPIDGLDDAERLAGVLVFHAGTRRGSDGSVQTAGGRVLTVVGRGPSFEEAIARAYAGAARIRFEGMRYRRDIGRKALVSAGRAGAAGR